MRVAQHLGDDGVGMSELTVLIVDDDRLILDLHELFISRQMPEWQVIAIADPLVALERYREGGIDIVVSDLRMPQLDGLTLIEQMQAHDPEASFLVLTGNADLSTALRAMNELGIERYLLKPTAPELVVSTIVEMQAQKEAKEGRLLFGPICQMFDALNIGALRLNADGQKLAANNVAEELLAGGEFLRVNPNGTVRAVFRDDTGKFGEFVRGPQNEDNDALLLMSDDESRQLTIYRHTDYIGCEKGDCFLILVDPSKRAMPSVHQIAGLWGISLAEARIVGHVIRGQSVAEAAEKCGVALNTARSYMKSAYRKMGISHQGELISRVLASSM